MITNFLRGKNKEAQNRINDLSRAIGADPNILWYPSAGDDYRDILELTHERARQHGIELLPDLIIHTDYKPDWLNLNGIPYNDERTQVEVENRFELELTQDIIYEVNPCFVDFPNDAPNEPTIYLMDISITSNILGQVRKSILYFLFENINFLEQIILKNKLHISHFVKVREGCGFGGNRKSISVVYAFLSAMKTKYLLVDHEEHTDYNLIRNLKIKHNLSPFGYELKKCDEIIDWSGFRVNVFSTAYSNLPMTDEITSEILETIRQ